MYENLTDRLRRYSEGCVAYKLDADFADAVQQAIEVLSKMENTTEPSKEENGRPVRMGKWIGDDEGYHCSECFYHAYGETVEVLSGHWHFCPNCGADMRPEEGE